MRGYRLICIFGLALSIISAFALALSTLFMRRQRTHHDYDVTIASTHFEYKLKEVMEVIVSTFVEIYIFICINSLYLEIKELGPYTRSTFPSHNVLINHHQQQQLQYQQQQHQQQQQPVRAVNIDSQSPPSYNAAMQNYHSGYSTQVVIPMHQLGTDVSSFKPQAV